MVTLLTQEGMQKIQDELDERRGEVRQEIARQIKEAKEQGDLSENAEYTAARQRQSENEARIAELEMVLKDAKVAKKDGSGTHVQIGSKVGVKSGTQEMNLEIVGTNEADPASGKISNESPMGKAFMGREKGDTVEVETPGGKKKFDIVSVE